MPDSLPACRMFSRGTMRSLAYNPAHPPCTAGDAPRPWAIATTCRQKAVAAFRVHHLPALILVSTKWVPRKRRFRTSGEVVSPNRKTDNASPQLKRIFSPCIALAPNHASLSQNLFPQVIAHKEWLPQPQEPSESRMQIPEGLRINRRNRTQEMPREPTQKHPADASGNNAFPYSHSIVKNSL